MHVSSTLLLALPVLGVAAEGVFDQYKAKFQNFLGQFGANPPATPQEQATEPAKGADTKAAPKVAPKNIEYLTVGNWRQTLYAPVKPDATEPVEWWVFITGRNKTCFGQCVLQEAAWNETAPKIGALPDSPYLAYLNCEDNPLLCNIWSATASTIWSWKLLPPPAEAEIHMKRLMPNNTSPKTIMDLYQSRHDMKDWTLNESIFHPINGTFAKYGIGVPIAYILYFFSVVPNWAVMLIVSFLSRSMMNRRMGDPNRPGQAAPAAAAPGMRSAPPGDAAGPR